MLTVRDLLSWVDFINVTESRLGPEYAVLHGMFLVLLDGLSLGKFLALTALVICLLTAIIRYKMTSLSYFWYLVLIDLAKVSQYEYEMLL